MFYTKKYFEEKLDREINSDSTIFSLDEGIGDQGGTFKKVCQAAFLVQLNFQSIWKENIKLRHS